MILYKIPKYTKYQTTWHFFPIKKYSRWILYFVAQNSLPGLKKPKAFTFCVNLHYY